jgi:hypothetical protein
LFCLLSSSLKELVELFDDGLVIGASQLCESLFLFISLFDLDLIRSGTNGNDLNDHFRLDGKVATICNAGRMI